MAIFLEDCGIFRRLGLARGSESLGMGLEVDSLALLPASIPLDESKHPVTLATEDLSRSCQHAFPIRTDFPFLWQMFPSRCLLTAMGKATNSDPDAMLDDQCFPSPNKAQSKHLSVVALVHHRCLGNLVTNGLFLANAGTHLGVL